MIHHHPGDELLLAHAAGTLQAGHALVVGAHAEGCAHCRARLCTFEALGGAMLETLEPAHLAPEALARTMARIDGTAPRRTAAAPAPAPAATAAPGGWPDLPAGTPWPSSLAGCVVSRWRWLGPGMRWSRVTLPHDPAANVFLLRIGAGKCLATHTHSNSELTQVLYGRFDDGRALFGPGDFDEADGSIHHQPVVQAGSECICLASVQGKVVFDNFLARWLGAAVGM
ncbi:ChrR family anti-sigma-E factor [Aquincola sp. MAHUQ-54]|uniref:ChrR family anti-sigma-E factor n=1 Tax=Aquincola agrisoli TaxID=3119538 RepID=A0AAW9Q798_9BURK